MDTETRRARLQKLIDDKFGGVISAAARATEMPTSWMSDVLRGRREFGERAARKIELNAALPAGWLDKATGRTPVEDLLDIVVDGEVVATVAAGAAITFRMRR